MITGEALPGEHRCGFGSGLRSPAMASDGDEAATS